MKIILTPEQIANRCEDKDGLANTRAINALYRNQDESHLYPINGAFDGTERAIRRVRKFQHDSGVASYGLEYAYALDSELTNIVNDPNL